MTNFKRGEQIVYIPTHADGDASHPDCERGFVALTGHVSCFCHFWMRNQPGVLRTRANSESRRVANLKADLKYVPQEVVDAWLTITEWETRYL